MATIETYSAPSVFAPATYPQVVKVTDAKTILFISGQLSYDEKGGTAHPGDFESQTRVVFQSLKDQVEAGGGTLANLVRVNVYVTELRYRNELMAVRKEFFGESAAWPGSISLMGVTGLSRPEWFIQADAIAVIE